MDKTNSEYAALTSDFTEWQIKNPKKIIYDGENVTEDGRLVFNLSINDTKFRLLCPANYPNHEDSFFVETECTDFWCIALNEFIVDSPEKLTLGVILAKTFLYYTPASKKSYQSSENESDNENDNYWNSNKSDTEDSESNDIDEWESMISKKKREWREKEGELRLRYNRPKISDMFDGIIMDHPQQVFSNTAASEILINDLINIIGSKDCEGIIADPVENDICRWSVILKDFNRDSKISKDLKETKELYGYDTVQLELDFVMDLYPSHPPLIRIIRPKLLGVFDSEDFVKLANWNPARDMMSVLKEIKDYINRDGRIDLHDKRNGVEVQIVEKILLQFNDALKGETKPDSSLLEEGKDSAIEIILIRLLSYLKNLVGEERSSDRPEADSYFTFYLNSNFNSFDNENSGGKFFETSNYSSRIFKASDRSMQSEKFETQNRCDYQKVDALLCGKKHCNIITNPAFGLESQTQSLMGFQNEKYLINDVSIRETQPAPIYFDNRNHRYNFHGSEQRNESNIQHLNYSVVSSFNADIKTLKGLSLTSSNNSKLELNENFSCLFKILEESVLIKFIRSKLSEDTFFTMRQRSTSLYPKIIQTIIGLASNPYLINLLAIADIADQSIADLLKIQEDNLRSTLEKLGDFADAHLTKQADLDKVELARSIIDASEFIESQLTKYCGRKSSKKVFSIVNNQVLDSHTRIHQVKSPDSIYKASLKDLRFCNCNIDVETHSFKDDYKAEMISSRNYFRIAQEFALLSRSLDTLELSSSIFVRVDNSKPSLMRALIIGARGTHCSGGCFSFDIYLRKDYPDDGLEINCTTFRDREETQRSNDRIAFSSFGEDSLSPDPNSSANISNILQALTFIQSEKLTSHIMYPENKNTWNLEESGRSQIFLTNFIRFAMINQMCQPIPGFEKVIVTHFSIRKDEIISELEQYDFLKNSELLDSLKKEFHRSTNTQKT